MIQFFKEIKIKTNGQKLIEITSKVLDFFDSTSIKEGILNLSILHNYSIFSRKSAFSI